MSKEKDYKHARAEALIYDDEGNRRELENIAEDIDEPINPSLYDDLVWEYGEEAVEEANIEAESFLDEVEDGSGCTEVWEHLSNNRDHD